MAAPQFVAISLDVRDWGRIVKALHRRSRDYERRYEKAEIQDEGHIAESNHCLRVIEAINDAREQ